MTNLTTKQIREILASAPDGDNHFLELDGNYTRYTKLASAHHSLSDLCRILEQEEEILELRERVEGLEQYKWIKEHEAIPPKNLKVMAKAGFESNCDNKFICSHNGLSWQTDRLVTEWCKIPKENTNERD